LTRLPWQVSIDSGLGHLVFTQGAFVLVLGGTVMSMHKWIACGLVLGLVAAARIAHGEDGRLSQGTLKDMGLVGLVEVSDADAELVRGQGFNGGSHDSWVSVSGKSYASINGLLGSAHSENRYDADGEHYATGRNSSFAGVKITTTCGKPRCDNGRWADGNKCGNGPSSRGMCNGNWHPGGGMGGGCKTSVTSVNFFAGGSSSAKAW
jgi:hypothetical protein